ncbi:mechanosensitive ion channel domain-containing protein [Microvirga sp. G4-2]|uniref:mechanosensitive ion channel domain-containing protein n=1 Tax=Microvirga sp. G4-2 TaxID=3434467 RepID=UPI004043B019
MSARCPQALAGALCGLVLLFSVQVRGGPAWAQTTPAPTAPPPQIQELLRLLNDPATRTWIDQQRQTAAPPNDATPQQPQAMTSEVLAARIVAFRAHVAALAAALPRLPHEFQRAGALLSQELQSRSLFGVVLLVFGFLGLGAGAEWIFRRATASVRGQIISRPVETAIERVRMTGMRLAFGLAHVAIFGLGSIGAFLVFDWPPLLRRIVLAYLFAALLLRFALLGGRILLSPQPVGRHDPEAIRVIPMTNEAARFWYRRMVLFVGWLAFGWATVEFVHTLGFSPEGREVIASILGIGLLALAVEAVWRWPTSAVLAPEASERPRHHILGAWLLSLYLVLLWGLWVAGLMGLFWLLVVAVVLPQAVTITRQAARHLLRPPHEARAPSDHDLAAVYLDRGVRVLLMIGAALFLAWVWGIDLVELTSRDTVMTRLVRGALSSIVILLVADLIWQVVKTHIDRRLSRMQAEAPPGSEAALSQARLRTLLPMFRMAAFIAVASVAVLMALSSLGVEIGPLIAGAGIFGVAIGFGSQTLVRDIISGIFYLLDDAFRVGEYIQSGSYKGTVESLGFRSVKLRHHRGPIFTIPYGQLGAVENMSRDWVIDKMTINVIYDTDLDQAKKVIKQVGKELAADPEFAPNIIEPLKMQGVEQFGDFAIQLRMKMMTRPGEQFVIRRKAYAMLKKAFDENGIRFAFPTVQVAGRDEAEPAAARQVLTLVKGKPPEEGG